MDLCHSHARLPIRLSSTRRYLWEEVRAKCRRVSGPFWLKVQGKLIPVRDEAALVMACQASAAYHDWVAYNAPEDDGFSKEMAERELCVAAEMEDMSDG
jgi:hypothetical protein